MAVPVMTMTPEEFLDFDDGVDVQRITAAGLFAFLVVAIDQWVILNRRD